MASETVQAVRQAEMNASSIEKEAQKQKDLILEDARTNANEMISSRAKGARLKADQELAKAVQRGEELIEATKQNAEKEILIMREMAKQKERIAIDLVLSTVV